MKEKEKKGELGYEGISWTKSRRKKWRNKLDKVQIKKKGRRNKLDEVQRGEWSKTGIMIA